MNSPAPWLLAGERVTLSHGGLEGTVDITRPDLGLHGIRLHGSAIGEMNLLAPRFETATSSTAAAVEDCFIRGRDLVVTYAPRRELPVRLQVYWRALPVVAGTAQHAGIDLQLSVQTFLLSATPSLAIVSRLPACAPERVAPHDASRGVPEFESGDPRRIGYWLCPLPASKLIYGEMLHPADVDRVELDQSEAGRVGIVHHTFAMPLEKGVILRARARSVFVPAADGRATLAAVYDDFLTAELPLTT